MVMAGPRVRVVMAGPRVRVVMDMGMELAMV